MMQLMRWPLWFAACLCSGKLLAEPTETHFQLNYKHLEIPLVFNALDAELDLGLIGIAYGERFAKNWFSEIEIGYSQSSLANIGQPAADGKGKFADLRFQYALLNTKSTFITLGINYIYHQVDEDEKAYRLKWAESGAHLAIAQRIFSPVTLSAGASYIDINGTQKFSTPSSNTTFQADSELRYELGVHLTTYEDGEIILKYFAEGQNGFEIALKKVYR